jgi:hypothetical protein
MALTGTGGGAMVASVIWSVMNDGKKAEKIDTLEKASVENLYRAPEGMRLVQDIGKADSGDVVTRP